MQARKFEHFLTQLAALTLRQRQRLIELLLPEVKRDQAVEVIEQHTAGRLVCPGCGAREFHKHGRAHGLVSPFILFALALVLLPWARFADTRAGCLGLAGAAAAGIAAGLLGLRFNPMLLLASAWTLWLSAILGWARVAFAEKMAGRRVPAR